MIDDHPNSLCPTDRQTDRQTDRHERKPRNLAAVMVSLALSFCIMTVESQK